MERSISSTTTTTFYTLLLNRCTDSAVFSDWYPAPIRYASADFACVGLALFYAKAVLCKNDALLGRVKELNVVMLSFYQAYLTHGSPRFWTRWDEQVVLLLECDRTTSLQMASLSPAEVGGDYDENEWIDVMHDMSLTLNRIKFSRHDTYMWLLVATGAGEFIELSSPSSTRGDDDNKQNRTKERVYDHNHYDTFTTGELLARHTFPSAMPCCHHMTEKALHALREFFIVG